MPKAKDPHVEAKEVAEKPTGAVVTGSSQAEVAASEAFGEDVNDPFNVLEKAKTTARRLREEGDRRVKEERGQAEIRAQNKKAMDNLGEAFEPIGIFNIFVKIAENAYLNNQENDGDKIKALLKSAKGSRGDFYVSQELENVLWHTIQYNATLMDQENFREVVATYLEKKIQPMPQQLQKLQDDLNYIKEHEYQNAKWKQWQYGMEKAEEKMRPIQQKIDEAKLKLDWYQRMLNLCRR